MPFLVAAVVLVGLLCAADLLLTMAVIRRLREHTHQLATLQRREPELGLLPAGSPLPTFAGQSVNGELVSSDTVRPEILAFLSTTCKACSTELPELVRYLRAGGVERAAAIVVVAGADSAEGRQLVDELNRVATVIREPMDGTIGRTFSVNVFPTFYLVSDATVRARAVAVAHLARPVAA